MLIIDLPAGAPPLARPGKTSSLAIASLCCGIGQVLFGPLTGIPAIGLGILALRQIRQARADGHGLAMAGLALGIVGVILNVAIVIAFVR